MIDVFELINIHPELLPGRTLSPLDFFEEFEYCFGQKNIKFTWNLYQECLRNLSYKGLSIYTVSKDDLPKQIHECGITVQDFMVLLYHESGINPFFFVLEIVRLPQYEGDYCKFTLDIGKVSQINAFMKGFHSVLFDPTQSGKTTLLAVLYNWIMMFRSHCSNIIIPVRSDGDYLMFADRVKAVSTGVPQMFHEPYIYSTFMYDSKNLYTNYVFVSDFEFLDDSQYSFINVANSVRIRPKNRVYYGFVGFNTKLQIVGNSTINPNPSKVMEGYVRKMSLAYREENFLNPEKNFENPVNAYGEKIADKISDADFHKYILTIQYDEHHIFTEDALERLKQLIPKTSYDYEVRRIRPMFNVNEDENT